MDPSNGNCTSPAPFLLKIYEIVDSSSSSSIVSWSHTGHSFVVWNSLHFCRDLLPQYFKHNNFSSFIRQLNTYGFRKVDPERWEFANEYFIRGQKHLLMKIHRRKPVHSHSKSVSKVIATVSEKTEFEEEIERLKHEKLLLESAVEKYKHENQQYQNQIELLAHTLLSIETKQQPQIMASLAQFLEKPDGYEFPGSVNKRRRLLVYNDVNESMILQGNCNTSICSHQPLNIEGIQRLDLDQSLTPQDDESCRYSVVSSTNLDEDQCITWLSPPSGGSDGF